MTDELARLRAKIDELDERLLRVLAERARVVRRLWAWKQRKGLARVDRVRERALRRRLLRRAEELDLNRATVARVLAAVVGSDLTRARSPRPPASPRGKLPLGP
ncbi:MAG: hypothetical protein AMXMBFR34_08700 [Myxococcaceae bacterium]